MANKQFATDKWVGDLIGSPVSSTAFIIKKGLLNINGITVSGSYGDNDFVNEEDISYTGYYTFSWKLPVIGHCSIKLEYIDKDGVDRSSINDINGNVLVQKDSSMTVTLIPSDGYIFHGNGNDPMTYTMNSNKSLNWPEGYNILLHISMDSGVKSVTLGLYKDSSGLSYSTKTYTSNIIVISSKGSSISWSAVAKDGYTLTKSSGSANMSSTENFINVTSEAIPVTPDKYTITYKLNTGIKNIAVKHAASDAHNLIVSDYSEEVDPGSYLDWFANAESGYTVDAPGKGTITSIDKDYTISPTATKEETSSTIIVQPTFASLSSDRRTVDISFKRKDGETIPYVSGTITPPSSFPSITIDGHTFIARTVTVVSGLKVKIMSDSAYATDREFTNVCVNPQPAFTIGGYTFQCDNTYGCTNNCTTS